jgi:hypothetical protein
MIKAVLGWMLCLCFVVSGCATVTDMEDGGATLSRSVPVPGPVSSGAQPLPVAKEFDAVKKRLTNSHLLYKGMTYQDAVSIMGNELKIGYQEQANMPGAFEPMVVKSPHREELLEADGRTILVLVYYNEIRKSDGLMAQEELFPVVFENDVLIGKGWDYYYDLKKTLGVQ